MIILIITDRNLRSFSFYLIFNVSFCTILVSIGNFLILDTSGHQDSTPLCQIQAFFTGVMETAQLFWQTIISYSLHVNINRYEGAVLYLQSKVIIINLLCFGLPVTIYVVLLSNGLLGVTDTFTCWI